MKIACLASALPFLAFNWQRLLVFLILVRKAQWLRPMLRLIRFQRKYFEEQISKSHLSFQDYGWLIPVQVLCYKMVAKSDKYLCVGGKNAIIMKQ